MGRAAGTNSPAQTSTLAASENVGLQVERPRLLGCRVRVQVASTRAERSVEDCRRLTRRL